MGKLRIGVIGAGSWAVASHLPTLAKRSDEVELVAVARRGAAQLARVQADWGFGHASEDYRDVLAAGVDACVVASPSGFHHEHAKAALEAGVHVLVEKPVTIQPSQAWDLAATADRAGRHLLVAFGWNYRPMIRRMRALLAAKGGIGEVEQVAIHMASPTRELLSNTGAYPQADQVTVPEPATWTDPRLSGGGYAQAQLSHALGLALWLTGLRGSDAFALMTAPLDAPVELHDAITLRFDNGAVGTMAGASNHTGAGGNKHQLEVRAVGSHGQFHVDVEREIAWLYRGAGDDTRLPIVPGDGAYDCEGPVNALLDLASGRLDGLGNHSPGELGARTVELLDAAYRSAASGKLEPVVST